MTAIALASCVACKPPLEREQAGGAPAFHDQHLYTGKIIVTTVPDTEFPVALAVDVQRDVIHVGDLNNRYSFPRVRGATEHESWQGGATIAVRNDDGVMLWHTKERGQDQVQAANTDDLEHPWTVLDYSREDSIGDPLVVGDRVAVMSESSIAHARIRAEPGDAPGVLALTHEPKGQPTSDGRRLVWVAQQGNHQFVLSTDARFDAVEVVWQQPSKTGSVSAAAPVGDSVVFIHVDRSSGVSKDQVLRVHADGSLVEVLPGDLHGDDLRLLPDGKQAWLYSRGRVWWIGEHSHAFARVLEGEATGIGADDGLLLWQQDDGIHIAGQPEIEFAAPFVMDLAIGGDDDDVWRGLTGPDVGAAYGVLPPNRIEKGARVTFAKATVEGALDRDIIRRIMRAHMPEIRSCYAAGLEDDPSLRGTIEIEFVIEPGGLVAKVEDRTGEQFADHDVSRCVARAMRRWKFPKPSDGESVTVRCPIELSPGE